MRHNNKRHQLGRTSSHRQATLANMAASLIKHKRIFTTTAKAKALRIYVEPLITRSKEDTTHSRRVVFSYLQNKTAVTELFKTISEKIGDRPGGYTRILKTGNRLGDNAAMCFIELVDFNENMLKDKKKTAGKTRRSRRKATGEPKASVAEQPVKGTPVKEKIKPPAEPKAEEPKVEEITTAETTVAEPVVAEPDAVEPAVEETQDSAIQAETETPADTVSDDKEEVAE
jgi:large subunit ribosomal protein L17